MGSNLSSSKTKENLMLAFAGESQARNRYTYAKQQAEQQQLFVLARLFEFTANQEKEHAMIFYNHLKECAGETIDISGEYPVNISENIIDILKMSNQNECHEHDEVYPAFAEVANREGFPDIAQHFSNIAKIEKYHADRFASFADLMEQNKLFTSDQNETWYCLNCGFIYEGTEAPQICPVCSAPQGYYIRLNMTPWTYQH